MQLIKILQEITEYYNCRGIYEEQIAEGIHIDKRSFQNWKCEKKNKRPRIGNFNALCEYLEQNDGGHFIINLRKAYFGETMEQIMPAATPRGSFPDHMAEDDIKVIRESFPDPLILKFLCSYIMSENKIYTVNEIMSGSDWAAKAGLISKFDVAMSKAKEIFGFNGPYDWKDKVIKYLTCKIIIFFYLAFSSRNM